MTDNRPGYTPINALLEVYGQNPTDVIAFRSEADPEGPWLEVTRIRRDAEGKVIKTEFGHRDIETVTVFFPQD